MNFSSCTLPGRVVDKAILDVGPEPFQVDGGNVGETPAVGPPQGPPPSNLVEPLLKSMTEFADRELIILILSAIKSAVKEIYKRLERATLTCQEAGKPHKTEVKAFHFRSQFAGTQILKVNSVPWYGNRSGP